MIRYASISYIFSLSLNLVCRVEKIARRLRTYLRRRAFYERADRRQTTVVAVTGRITIGSSNVCASTTRQYQREVIPRFPRFLVFNRPGFYISAFSGLRFGHGHGLPAHAYELDCI